jgi:hypothetical protein
MTTTLRIFKLEAWDGGPEPRPFAAVEDGGYIVATGITPWEARERSLDVLANLDVCRDCGARDEVWNRRDYCLTCGELLV